MENLDVIIEIVVYIGVTYLFSSKLIKERLKAYDKTFTKFDERIDALELYIRTIEAALQYKSYIDTEGIKTKDDIKQ